MGRIPTLGIEGEVRTVFSGSVSYAEPHFRHEWVQIHRWCDVFLRFFSKYKVGISRFVPFLVYTGFYRLQFWCAGIDCMHASAVVYLFREDHSTGRLNFTCRSLVSWMPRFAAWRRTLEYSTVSSHDSPRWEDGYCACSGRLPVDFANHVSASGICIFRMDSSKGAKHVCISVGHISVLLVVLDKYC